MQIIAVIFAIFSGTLELLAGDSAKVYVYARRGSAARSWLSITCDDVLVAELKQGAFFAINVAPGSYTFSVEKGVPLSVDAQLREDSFIRLGWSYGISRSPEGVERIV
ncbi:MAG: hypothetical protein M3Z09_06575 [Acidobacteriota bacterium]|nr:hypothetical protein [Acidobacteriota bacterium]